MAEEKVFSIDGLRRLILSFALEKETNVEKNDTPTCVGTLSDYFNNIIIQLVLYCFVPRFSFYFPR